MEKPGRLYTKLYWLFLTGSVASAVTLSIGLVWGIASGNSAGSQSVRMSPRLFFSLLFPDSATNVLNLGIIILMLIPLASLLIAAQYFFSTHDKRHGWACVGIILILFLGILLGLLQV
ncbi:MAG: DUF1634 domain-containing protein [candidate division Zixibacteria bacterium]|nr:DUF1634 domain-containing protein [candidate division Zixibacteria bacterium]